MQIMRDQMIASIGQLGAGKAFWAKNISQMLAVPSGSSTETTMPVDSSYPSTRLTSLDLFRVVKSGSNWGSTPPTRHCWEV